MCLININKLLTVHLLCDIMFLVKKGNDKMFWNKSKKVENILIQDPIQEKENRTLEVAKEFLKQSEEDLKKDKVYFVRRSTVVNYDERFDVYNKNFEYLGEIYKVTTLFISKPYVYTVYPSSTFSKLLYTLGNFNDIYLSTEPINFLDYSITKDYVKEDFIFNEKLRKIRGPKDTFYERVSYSIFADVFPNLSYILEGKSENKVFELPKSEFTSMPNIRENFLEDMEYLGYNFREQETEKIYGYIYHK